MGTGTWDSVSMESSGSAQMCPCQLRHCPEGCERSASAVSSAAACFNPKQQFQPKTVVRTQLMVDRTSPRRTPWLCVVLSVLEEKLMRFRHKKMPLSVPGIWDPRATLHIPRYQELLEFGTDKYGTKTMIKAPRGSGNRCHGKPSLIFKESYKYMAFGILESVYQQCWWQIEALIIFERQKLKKPWFGHFVLPVMFYMLSSSTPAPVPGAWLW